jgi:hypothetical protein
MMPRDNPHIRSKLACDLLRDHQRWPDLEIGPPPAVSHRISCHKTTAPPAARNNRNISESTSIENLLELRCSALSVSTAPILVTIYGRGRDIEEIEKALSFDTVTGRWTELGDVSEVRRSDERNTVLHVLRAAKQPMSPAEIAGATKMSPVNVRQLLGGMVAAGEIELVGRGRYVAAGANKTQ